MWDLMSRAHFSITDGFLGADVAVFLSEFGAAGGAVIGGQFS